MSFPIFFKKRKRGGEDDQSFLNLTITTTASPQTVRIQQLTPQIDSTIDWGDGTTTLIVANRTSVIDKTYATAGVYKVKVQNPDRIVSLDLRVAAIGGLNTRDLRNAPMTGTFLLTSLGTGCVLDSAYMVDWRPSDWRLSGMPAGTYTINSADMTDWRPTTWVLYTMPAAGSSYTFAASCMRAWITVRELKANSLGITTATVNTIIADVYAGRATYTWNTPVLDVGGATNDSPSGIYQNPRGAPTSPLEQVFVLANDSNSEGIKKWTITWNGGSAP